MVQTNLFSYLFKKTNILILSILLIFISCHQKRNESSEEQAARAVLERVLGDKSDNIELKIKPLPTGENYHTYSAASGVLKVEADNQTGLTRGVYDYLKNNNLGMLDWTGSLFNLNKEFPDATSTTIKTPYKIRHAYNAVTFGYTTPFWDWKRWEQELDWQAMHGFNMLMAPIATEAIATRVWKKLGLTQKEIDEYYVGPTLLPWNRMGCIQQVGGSLPKEWHEDQIALQHKILQRMRALGIKPVIQAFAGFIPKAIKRLYPNIQTHQTLWNAGFPETQRPVLIMPDQDLFAQISKLYLEEWQKEFGNADYFLIDSFNELELPKTETGTTNLLAEYGKRTYDIVKSFNKDAVWVIQGWMFAYQRHIWSPENVKALFSKVPNDGILILDYANDYDNNWKPMNGFNGKPWVYGFVPNMGGKTAYTGKISLYASGASEALASEKKGNLTGFTISGEGLENNAVIYELLTDVAFKKDSLDLDTWIAQYSKNRYGGYPENMSKSWKLLFKSAYSKLEPHPQFGWQLGKASMGTVFNSPDFYEAVKLFLSCSNELKNSKAYVADALEMVALSLGLKADEWFSKAKTEYENKKIDLGDKAGERGLELLSEFDRLLESHPLDRLDRWINAARSHGNTDSLKDFYELNARRIITVWGPPVNDYSCRVWSGLVRDFYKERMVLVLKALKNNEKFNTEWEIAWTKQKGISPITPYKEPLEMARTLVEKALTENIN